MFIDHDFFCLIINDRIEAMPQTILFALASLASPLNLVEGEIINYLEFNQFHWKLAVCGR